MSRTGGSRSTRGCRLTRREVLPALGAALAFSACGGSSSPTPPPPPPLSDDAFLDAVQRALFLYFWEQASATTGQVKDRALAAGNDTRTLSSIAATGFGLTALAIGAERGYGDGGAIAARVSATLTFLLDQSNVNGFYYHFIDMESGARAPGSEVSSIDTAILLCGVLTCRAYFQDATIQSLATQIYERIDWPWMLNGGTTFSMGWTPENGFIASRWDTYSELMMLYLLAIGSTTHPAPAASWDAFARPTLSYAGYTYITNPSAPLFIHQYSHAWFDFRNRQDAYANYFDNSVSATLAHRQFCLALAPQFADYQASLWGISASDSVNGYTVWGGPPAMGPIDGSIVPCAAGGSLSFASAECIAVLRNIQAQYPRAWQRYGFVDAFNPLTGWYDTDVLGIDAGITLLMAENERSGFVWNTFMANPEALGACAAVGLKPVAS
ncbi:MAG TPA: glucoamylase family protein [Steroidobacteraceae bacterium]|nr:glucoamylase family protein [Steroidobacteraceae bacterium]